MAEMINITFPDGNSRKYDKGVNGLAIANSISTSLAKNSIAIKEIINKFIFFNIKISFLTKNS